MVQLVKNPRANAEDARDTGSIPGSGRSPGKEMTPHSSILAWRIPWTEEPGGLQSRSQRRLKQLSMPQTGGWVRPSSHSSPFPTQCRKCIQCGFGKATALSVALYFRSQFLTGL